MFGLWPSHENESRLYSICNTIIMTLLSIFLVTIICDLYEASGNFVMFGDDLVVILGLSLILLKIWLYRNRIDEIESIIEEFNILHRHFAHNTRDNRQIRRLQAKFFFTEIAWFAAYTVMATIFFAAVTVQPQFTNQPLPFRAQYPFGLHDPERHPNFCAIIYVFQCLCTIYNLYTIIFIDNVGCTSFSQTTLNLKILCIRIREMGAAGPGTGMWNELREIVEFHQHIIAIVDKVNRCFYSNYVAQMVASTFMICLTAFEALLSKDQLMVAVKFQMYMLSAFMQLFYWCWMGNMAYFESMEVATAALEIHNWFEESPQFQRNLMFLIQRAQKPLAFRAKPLYGFTFESFTGMLSSSYSYFALLRTMTD